MNKLYTTFLSLAMLVGLSANAQVEVTFRVDVTNYKTTEAIKPEGIRIGGNFGDFGATTAGGNNLASWTPSDANSAMTQVGSSDIWEMVVIFDAAAAGSDLFYKFVNGDWGTNEGLAGSNIAANGCGVDDGGGNINRKLVLPSANTTLTFCWDECEAVCNALSVTETPTAFEGIKVYPNPAKGMATVSFNALEAGNQTIEVVNAIGQRVILQNVENAAAGMFQYNLNLDGLSGGLYFVTVSNASGKTTAKLQVK
jgi:hypothetical protein